MLKKGRPEKEEPKPRVEGFDQEEPFLKTLQKKTRNITKKLTEISELEQKQNLKPEQVEKVNRKDALSSEKQEIERFTQLYRDTLVENTAYYRGLQTKQFENLSKALALEQSSAVFPEKAKLTQLWNVLATQNHKQTLPQRAEAILASLKDFSNDFKLIKQVIYHFERNSDKQVQVPLIQQAENGKEKIHEEIKIQNEPQKVEQFKNNGKLTASEEIIVTIKVEEPKKKYEEKTESKQIQKIELKQVEKKVEETKPEVKPEVKKIEEKPQTKYEEKPQVKYEEKKNAEIPLAKPQNKKVQEVRIEELKPFIAEPQKNGGQGVEHGKYVPKNNPKKYYQEDNRANERSKYVQNRPFPSDRRGGYQQRTKRLDHPNRKRNDSKDSSSLSGEGIEVFKKHEIEQLKAEGFMMVDNGKPKPREQQVNYLKEHGRKQDRR